MTCQRDTANKWQNQNGHPHQGRPQLYALNHHLYKSLRPSCHRIIDVRAGRQIKELLTVDTKTKEQEAQRGQWLALDHTAEEWQSQGDTVKQALILCHILGDSYFLPWACVYDLTPPGATPSVTWTWCSESLGWSTRKKKTGLDFSTCVVQSWAALTPHLELGIACITSCPRGLFSKWKRSAAIKVLTFPQSSLGCAPGHLCLPQPLLELAGEQSLTQRTEKIYLTRHWFSI